VDWVDKEEGSSLTDYEQDHKVAQYFVLAALAVMIEGFLMVSAGVLLLILYEGTGVAILTIALYWEIEAIREDARKNRKVERRHESLVYFLLEEAKWSPSLGPLS
jgi:hypothetical protein